MKLIHWDCLEKMDINFYIFVNTDERTRFYFLFRLKKKKNWITKKYDYLMHN